MHYLPCEEILGPQNHTQNTWSFGERMSRQHDDIATWQYHHHCPHNDNNNNKHHHSISLPKAVILKCLSIPSPNRHVDNPFGRDPPGAHRHPPDGHHCRQAKLAGQSYTTRKLMAWILQIGGTPRKINMEPKNHPN